MPSSSYISIRFADTAISFLSQQCIHETANASRHTFSVACSCKVGNTYPPDSANTKSIVGEKKTPDKWLSSSKHSGVNKLEFLLEPLGGFVSHSACPGAAVDFLLQ